MASFTLRVRGGETAHAYALQHASLLHALHALLACANACLMPEPSLGGVLEAVCVAGSGLGTVSTHRVYQ